MSLEIGTTLGSYDVTAKIGEGGMGEVYRAKDTKLDRDVALKVLPQAFTDDPDRLARFEREAKVLASLNHPNIGHIYGLEEANGVNATCGSPSIREGQRLHTRTVVSNGAHRHEEPRQGIRVPRSSVRGTLRCFVLAPI